MPGPRFLETFRMGTMRKLILAAAALAATAGMAAAATLEPLPGWVGATHIDKAIGAAKKRQCPIVFLIGPREGRGVLSSRGYMRHPGVKGMVRVLIIRSARPPRAFMTVTSQVEEPDDDIPVLYIATPELRILAFVEAGSNRKAVHGLTRFAKKTMAWIRKSRGEIKSAERAAAAGRFREAVQVYSRIMKQDKQKAVLVHGTWNVAITTNEVNDFYFPGLDTKLEDLGQMSEDRLAKARTAFENKDYVEAKKLLLPMVRDKADLDAVKRAAELLEKVEEKLMAK